jgi:cell division protein FtsB
MFNFLKNIDKKVLEIILLSIALAIVSYIAFTPTPVNYDKELIEKQIKELKQANDSLLTDNKELKENNTKFESKIDSLQALKNKSAIRYVTKSKEIDAATVSGTIDELKIIFAINGIK